MREDPIIYEDWTVGYPLQDIFNPIRYADFAISLVVVLIIFILGIVDSSTILLFGSFFVFVLILFIDLLTQPINKSLITNLIETTIVLLSISLLYSVATTHSLLVDILLSFAYLVKYSFVSGKSSLANIYGELLIPRTESVQIKLDHQLKVLKATDFSLDKHYLKRFRNEVFFSQVLPFVVIGTLFGIIYFIIRELFSSGAVSGFIIFDFVLLLYTIIISFTILILIMIWRVSYINRASGQPYLQYLFSNMKSKLSRVKRRKKSSL